MLVRVVDEVVLLDEKRSLRNGNPVSSFIRVEKTPKPTDEDPYPECPFTSAHPDFVFVLVILLQRSFMSIGFIFIFIPTKHVVKMNSFKVR